jgi:ADP-ribose pyrophosphatase
MNKQGPQNEWITEADRTLLESPIMSVHELSCRSSEDSRSMKFYTLKSRDWCNIIPITEDGKVILVKQFRIGVARHTLEIPGGVADPTDGDIQTTALREMTEETGYVPLPGAQCKRLGSVYSNPAIQNNRTYSLIVGPVRKERNQNLDPGEMIEIIEVPFSEIPKMLLDGRIEHGLMLNTFFFLLMGAPEFPALLEKQLEMSAVTKSRN